MISSQSALDMPAGGSKLGLFTNQIIKFVILGLGCIFSVMVGVQVTDSDTNGLAVFVRYIAAAMFIVGIVTPRLGIYLVLFMCPILDLVKRCLILFTSISMLDVASVLAVAPVTMGGAVLGTAFTRLIFRRKAPIPGEKYLFLIMLATTSLVALSTILHNTESTLSMFKLLSEACIFLCLILMVPVHFPKTEDVATLLRWCIVVFAPVALYGFWQYVNGLSDFEMRYLLSGLTITQGDYLGSERVFSTLNSNHSFSLTMACCSVIALLQRHLPADGKYSKMAKKYAWAFFLLFCVATIISLRRTGWLVIGFSLAGAFCFRTRIRTIVFYSLCLAGGLALILNAEWIYTQLPGWETAVQTALPGHEQAFSLQTFNDRLGSFQTLRDNTAIWTLFGMPAAQRQGIAVHDAMTETIISYGIVGTGGFLIVLICVLAVSHRLAWRATNPAEHSYAALLLAFIFSNLFVGAIMQSHINLFPVNFIFWLCAGALLKITFHQQSIAEAKPQIDFEELAEALHARTNRRTLTLPSR